VAIIQSVKMGKIVIADMVGGVSAMMSTTITVAILVSLIIGLAFGSVIAGIAMMERRSTRHWVVYLRLSEDLYRRLSEAATDHRWSLRAEIINRLEASFGPTKVV